MTDVEREARAGELDLLCEGVRRWIEGHFVAVEVGPPRREYVPGEPYLTVVNGAVKPEGDPIPFAATAREAVRAFKAGFDRYWADPGPGPKLVWRTPPEFYDTWDEDRWPEWEPGKGRYAIRCRFVVFPSKPAPVRFLVGGVERR